MKYRRLGKWGLQVSEVGIGSWMTDLADAAACAVAEEVLDAAYDSGVNFFDCADAYSGGDAERWLGGVLAKWDRPSYVVSTKVFFPTMPGPNGRGLSRKHIVESIDASLARLGLDYVDLYYCHRPDPDTPLEETAQAMSDLVAAGKVLYWGVSEWTPAQIARVTVLTREMGLRPLSAIQPQYHMFDRHIEAEIVPLCREEGIGITPFSPLAQGLLTGKYRSGRPVPEGSRATHQADRQINALLTEENLGKVEQLLVIAGELGCTLAQLALAWILREPQISSVITGASKAGQLAGNIGAVGVELTPQTLERIEGILDYRPVIRRIG